MTPNRISLDWFLDLPEVCKNHCGFTIQWWGRCITNGEWDNISKPELNYIKDLYIVANEVLNETGGR